MKIIGGGWLSFVFIWRYFSERDMCLLYSQVVSYHLRDENNLSNCIISLWYTCHKYILGLSQTWYYGLFFLQYRMYCNMKNEKNADNFIRYMVPFMYTYSVNQIFIIWNILNPSSSKKNPNPPSCFYHSGFSHPRVALSKMSSLTGGCMFLLTGNFEFVFWVLTLCSCHSCTVWDFGVLNLQSSKV